MTFVEDRDRNGYLFAHLESQRVCAEAKSRCTLDAVDENRAAMQPPARLSRSERRKNSNENHICYTLLLWAASREKSLPVTLLVAMIGPRDRGGRSTLFPRAHLKLRLRDVDLPTVDELDDELEICEAHVLRHDDRRVFTGVRQQQLLEVGTAGRQHHLRTHGETEGRDRRDISALLATNYVVADVNANPLCVRQRSLR